MDNITFHGTLVTNFAPFMFLILLLKSVIFNPCLPPNVVIDLFSKYSNVIGQEAWQEFKKSIAKLISVVAIMTR